ncbi:hypothetical protein GCM10009839_25470 [Catenulispora yoronensis]|uniref:Chitin-binding type-1 domain-containing protein n=1 Tax=Catenulispora yoronensis TaxID=450799 RepID=A0ABP5FJ16_9ACTN
MKFIGSLGDKMLSRVLKQDTAGACIPEHGESCGRVPVSGGHCGGDGHWYQRYCNAVLSCTGSCVSNGQNCYDQHTGSLC